MIRDKIVMLTFQWGYLILHECAGRCRPAQSRVGDAAVSQRPGHARLRWRIARSGPCIVAVQLPLSRCVGPCFGSYEVLDRAVWGPPGSRRPGLARPRCSMARSGPCIVAVLDLLSRCVGPGSGHTRCSTVRLGAPGSRRPGLARPRCSMACTGPCLVAVLDPSRGAWGSVSGHRGARPVGLGGPGLAAAGPCAPPLQHGSYGPMCRGPAVTSLEVRGALFRVIRGARPGRPGAPGLAAAGPCAPPLQHGSHWTHASEAVLGPLSRCVGPCFGSYEVLDRSVWGAPGSRRPGLARPRCSMARTGPMCRGPAVTSSRGAWGPASGHTRCSTGPSGGPRARGGRALRASAAAWLALDPCARGPVL